MKIHTILALTLTIGAFGCGDDESGGGVARPTTVVQQSPDVSGRWASSQMWLTQFRRIHDGYNGSWTCSGSMTITQDRGSRNFRGFAVVGSPCPATSFELTGSVEPSGAIAIQMSGPRPGAGSCPQPPVGTYSGLLQGRTISARAEVRVSCPGEGEGEHVFNQILNANQSF